MPSPRSEVLRLPAVPCQPEPQPRQSPRRGVSMGLPRRSRLRGLLRGFCPVGNKHSIRWTGTEGPAASERSATARCSVGVGGTAVGASRRCRGACGVRQRGQGRGRGQWAPATWPVEPAAAWAPSPRQLLGHQRTQRPLVGDSGADSLFHRGEWRPRWAELESVLSLWGGWVARPAGAVRLTERPRAGSGLRAPSARFTTPR